MKTITGKEITATPNHSAKTFTIRTDYAKYRTNRMTTQEFKSNLHNTANDWQNFLSNSGDYYDVSKSLGSLDLRIKWLKKEVNK